MKRTPGAQTIQEPKPPQALVLDDMRLNDEFAQRDFRLGWGPLDEVHEEFVHLVRMLAIATDDEVARALRAVQQHCQGHFGQEDAWMKETGFPAFACHAQEHAAVLASIDGVMRKVAAGDFQAARRLADALMEWFPAHADHLDSALAHWMCHRRLGGKPVVLHRPIARPAGADAQAT